MCKISLFLIFIFCDQKKNYVFQNYNKNVGEYRIVRFYKKINFQKEITKSQISEVIKYYKVIYNKENKVILQECYKNSKLMWYKEYLYKNKKISNKILYNSNKKKLNEIIYQLKNVIKIVYIYDKLFNLILKKNYLNYKAHGWWNYYNSFKKIVKKEYYIKGKLDKTWFYFYDSKGKLFLEENYDFRKKLLYRYKY